LKADGNCRWQRRHFARGDSAPAPDPDRPPPDPLLARRCHLLREPGLGLAVGQLRLELRAIRPDPPGLDRRSRPRHSCTARAVSTAPMTREPP